MKALLSTEEMSEGDRQLIELVKDFDDPRLLPFLVSQLRRTEDNPPEIARTILPVVAELLNSKRIAALAETFQGAPYDDEDEEDRNADQDTVRTRSATVRERSAQIRLFLQQVDRIIRSRSEAQNLKPAQRKLLE